MGKYEMKGDDINMVYQYVTAPRRRRELFYRYMEELNTMLDRPMTEKEIEDTLILQLDEPHIEWVDIYLATEIVGFMIVGHENACHPQADRFIINMYVIPEQRRKHLASAAVNQYLKKHPGIYCLDILNKNAIGQIFWRTAFSRNHYEPMHLPYIPHGEGKGAVMHAWKPRKK